MKVDTVQQSVDGANDPVSRRTEELNKQAEEFAQKLKERMARRQIDSNVDVVETDQQQDENDLVFDTPPMEASPNRSFAIIQDGSSAGADSVSIFFIHIFDL